MNKNDLIKARNNKKSQIENIKMKFFKYTIYAFLLTAGIVFAAVYARADINPLLNFTGKVTAVDGSELADGVYNMSFRLYATATGGSSIWSENLTAANMFAGTISNVGSSSDGVVYTYSGGTGTSTLRAGQYLSAVGGTEGFLIVDFNHATNTVTVASSSALLTVGEAVNNRPFIEGGVIDVDLGTVQDLTNIDFNQALYLEVAFNGEIMQPRKMYEAAPYAFNAAKLGGYAADVFANLEDNETIIGQWNFADLLAVATSSSATALTVTQNGSGNVVEFKVGATTSFAVLNDGRVRIGNYYFPAVYGAPGYILKTDAAGNLYWAVDFASAFGADGQTLWATSSDNLLIHPIDTTYVTVIGNNATSTMDGQIFEVNGSALFDTVNISNQQQIRFYDSDSSNYMAIRASGTIASNFILTMPGDAGTAGLALVTDGNGNLSWAAPSSFTYVNAGISGQVPYYAASGSQLSGTSSLFIAPSGNIGIGTTTPSTVLSIGTTAGSQVLISANGQITDGIWMGDPVGVAYGGTGTSSLNNLITLGTHTTGNYIASTTGSNTITITGTPDEGWVPVFSVTDDSITASKLAVSGNGTAGYVLTADGDGTFSWSEAGASSGFVKQSFAGQLAFYAADGIVATGTTGLFWDNGNARLGIGTTTPAGALSVGATANNQFLVGSTGIITDGEWQGDAINDQWIASSTYWNAAYFGRVTNATAPITFTGNTIGLDGLYNIPLGASTTQWNTAYNIVNSKYMNWDAVYASSSSYNWAYNIVNSNYLDWNTAVGWGDHAGLYDTLGQATSTLNSHIATYNHLNYDAIVASSTWYNWAYNTVSSNYAGWNAVAASSTWYNWAYNTVNSKFAGWDAVAASSTFYNAAYNWGNHALQNYFSTSSARVLEVSHGGTGLSSIANQSLIYASSDNTLAQFAVGAEGEVLVVSGGNLAWASSSPAAQHSLLSVIHSDVDATSTLVRGDLMVVNSDDKWSRMGLGPSGYILYSNGSDAYWATTTSITALGEIIQGSWKAEPIALAYGGTGAASATSARENLGLDDMYEFGINSTGTAGWLWQSDGDGRGQWAATTSLGLGGTAQTNSKFIGTTTATSDGHFATGTLEGYAAANAICDYEYSGSHYCRTYDIMVTIEQDDIVEWGTSNADAWIAQGPPGYTANSNDCNGWTTNDIGYLGAFWVFNKDTGGYGKLINCTQLKPLACCQWQ